MVGSCGTWAAGIPTQISDAAKGATNGLPWLRFAVASAGGGRSARQRGADAWPRREADR